MRKTLFTLALILIIPLAVSSQKKKKDVCYFKQKRDGCYFINALGEKVSCGAFVNAYGFEEGRGLIEKNLKFGYVDSLGQRVIDFCFTDAGLFVDGLAFAARNDKYGFINKMGEFVIEPQFALANNFENGFAMVMAVNTDTAEYGNSPYLKGLLNRKGELLGGDYFTEIMNTDGNYYKILKKDSLFTLYKDGTKKFVRPNEDELVNVVDVMPEFAGGDMELGRYVATSVRYPISAFENGIQGRCYINFMVNEEGTIENVKAASPGPPILLKEAIRVVSSMPQWTPAMRNGKPIKVFYTVPVNFVLQ